MSPLNIIILIVLINFNSIFFVKNSSTSNIYSSIKEECKCYPPGTLKSIRNDNNINNDNTSCDQCECKKNVEGKLCDQCKSGFYDLDERNPLGCSKCWCFGFNTTCKSANLGTKIISLSRNWNSWMISDGNNIIAQPLNEGHLVIASDDIPDIPIYYWSAPEDYLNNKLSTYGAILNILIGADVLRGDSSGEFVENVNVILESGRNKTRYGFKTNPEIYRKLEFMQMDIKLIENNWFKLDSPEHVITREEFTLALMDLKALLIRAKYHTGQIEGMLYSVNMSIGSTNLEENIKFNGTEECDCPKGYSGLSCGPTCDYGYRRINNIIIDGICEKCDCNNHTITCDPFIGKCGKCLDNTYGEHCEQCLPGFYGNALNGKPNDCKPCECPSIDNNNSNQALCIAISEDNYKCAQCPYPQTGDKCEKCLPGFYGDLSIIGNTCKPCNCQFSESTNCDSITGECICYSGSDCKCKKGFEGKDCSECAKGYTFVNGICQPCEDSCTNALLHDINVLKEVLKNYNFNKYNDSKMNDKNDHIFSKLWSSILNRSISVKDLYDRFSELLKLRKENINNLIKKIDNYEEQINMIKIRIDSSNKSIDTISKCNTNNKHLKILLQDSFNLYKMINNLKDSVIKKEEWKEIIKEDESVKIYLKDLLNQLMKKSFSYELHEAQTELNNSKVLSVIVKALSTFNINKRINIIKQFLLNVSELIENKILNIREPLLKLKIDNQKLHDDTVMTIRIAKDKENYIRLNIDHGKELVNDSWLLIQNTKALINLIKMNISLYLNDNVNKRINDKMTRYLSFSPSSSDNNESVLVSVRKCSEHSKDMVEKVNFLNNLNISIINEYLNKKKSNLKLLEKNVDNINYAEKIIKNRITLINNYLHIIQLNISFVNDIKAKISSLNMDNIVNKLKYIKNNINSKNNNIKLLENKINTMIINRYKINNKTRKYMSSIKKINYIKHYSESVIKAVNMMIAVDIINKTLIDNINIRINSLANKSELKTSQFNKDIQRLERKFNFIEDKINNKDSIQRLSKNIRILREHLKLARIRASEIKISITGNGNCTRNYYINSISSLINHISLTYSINNNNNDSLLLLISDDSVANNNNNNNADNQMIQITNDFIGLEMVNRKIRLLWNSGGKTAIIDHPELIKTNDKSYSNDTLWYKINVKRIANKAILSVVSIGSLSNDNEVSLYDNNNDNINASIATDEDGDNENKDINQDNKFNQLVTDISKYGDNYTLLNINSGNNLWIGKIPENLIRPEFKSKYFYGCIYNVHYDNTPIGLWNYRYNNIHCKPCIEGATKIMNINTYSYNGYSYSQSKQIDHYDPSRYLVSLSFRSLDENATLFYTFSHKTKHYLSLSLNNGYILYTIGFNNEIINLQTKRKYNHGYWIRVNAEIDKQDIYLNINNNEEIQENKLLYRKLLKLHSTELYFGGIKSLGSNVINGLVGCMKDVQIDTTTINLATKSIGVTIGCENRYYRSINFIGNGYVQYKSLVFNINDNITLTFRTDQINGLLMYNIFNPNQANIIYSHLIIENGHLVFAINYNNNNNNEIIKLKSYKKLNTGEYHSVLITRDSQDSFKMIINDKDIIIGLINLSSLSLSSSFSTSLSSSSSPSSLLSIFSSILSNKSNGKFFLGGIPKTLVNIKYDAFFGIIRDVIVKNELIPLNKPISFSGVRIGHEDI